MSSEFTLPSAVDELVGNVIRSIEELEIMLLLTKSRRACTVQELARELGLSEAVALTALQGLVQAELVVRFVESSSREYVFDLRQPGVRPVIDQLAAVYESSRIEIIGLLSERAILRLRSGVHRMFSTTFPASTRGSDDGPRSRSTSGKAGHRDVPCLVAFEKGWRAFSSSLTMRTLQRRSLTDLSHSVGMQSLGTRTSCARCSKTGAFRSSSSTNACRGSTPSSCWLWSRGWRRMCRSLR